jgi:hypothetical protein
MCRQVSFSDAHAARLRKACQRHDALCRDSAAVHCIQPHWDERSGRGRGHRRTFELRAGHVQIDAEHLGARHGV